MVTVYRYRSPCSWPWFHAYNMITLFSKHIINTIWFTINIYRLLSTARGSKIELSWLDLTAVNPALIWSWISALTFLHSDSLSLSHFLTQHSRWYGPWSSSTCPLLVSCYQSWRRGHALSMILKCRPTLSQNSLAGCGTWRGTTEWCDPLLDYPQGLRKSPPDMSSLCMPWEKMEEGQSEAVRAFLLNCFEVLLSYKVFFLIVFECFIKGQTCSLIVLEIYVKTLFLLNMRAFSWIIKRDKWHRRNMF